VLANVHDDFFFSYLPNDGFVLDHNTLHVAGQYTKYLRMISAHFRSFMQRKRVLSYRRFGTSYLSHLLGPCSP